MQKVLQAATAENDNPDIRDRAYVYWRLLSNTSDPNAAKNIVLSEKPPIVTTIQSLPPSLLDKLLNEISTLASVYHQPPEQFVGQGRFGADAVQKAAIEYVYHCTVVLLSFCFQLLTYFPGNNFKMRARTHWQRQRPLQQLAAPHLLHRHRTTWRTCWISILTAQHRHRHRKNREAVCLVWKDSRGHL